MIDVPGPPPGTRRPRHRGTAGARSMRRCGKPVVPHPKGSNVACELTPRARLPARSPKAADSPPRRRGAEFADLIDTRGAGTHRPTARLTCAAAATSNLGGQDVGLATRPRAAALADRIAGAWRGLRAGAGSTPSASDPGLELRLAAVDTRLAQMEDALEDLQDALYRQARREDETRADLQKRTEPRRIAKELSADARRRGL